MPFVYAAILLVLAYLAFTHLTATTVLMANDTAAIDMVERVTNEVFDWDSYKHDNGCPGGPLDHILCGHGNGSGKGKSEFDSNLANEVYSLIEEVAATAVKNAKLTRPGGSWEVVVNVGRRIGMSEGKATQWIKIFFEKVNGAKPMLRTATPTPPPGL